MSPLKHVPYLIACLLLLSAVSAAPGGSAFYCASPGGNLLDQVAETCNDVLHAAASQDKVGELKEAVESLCENQLGIDCVP